MNSLEQHRALDAAGQLPRQAMNTTRSTIDALTSATFGTSTGWFVPPEPKAKCTPPPADTLEGPGVALTTLAPVKPV